MGGIKLTREDKAAGLKEIGGDVQPFITWHDPETGQEFPRLPADAPNAANYLIRGFRMGPAPPELKAKWEAGKADRAAEADRRLKERLKNTKLDAEQRRKLQDMEQSPSEPVAGASTDEVASAVIDKLVALGVIKVPEAAEETMEEETEAEAPADDAEPVQPKLL